MPTYEYRCAQGHEFEEFQSIVAEPLTVCPRCGSAVERVVSGGTGLIFKGSGFYITDYTKKSGDSKSSPTTTTKSTESGKSASETSTKSDSGASSTS